METYSNTGPCTNSEFTLEFRNVGVDEILKMSDKDFQTYISVPPRERSIFDVSLAEYPTQPWSRPAQILDANRKPAEAHALLANLSQWFNYKLTPKTFATYAARQQQVAEAIRARASGGGAAPIELPTHSATQQMQQR